MSRHAIGIMSGTSVDGIDAVLLTGEGPWHILGHVYLAFPPELRLGILALSATGDDEIHRGALIANRLAHEYASAVHQLCHKASVDRGTIQVIGCHGQTVRHRPEAGYTTQLVNAALLAELTGITVVSDFRSRDIAAGGQGAPLVPGFHQAAFSSPGRHRAIVNIGGIANITFLPAGAGVSGFDCGPGNLLMDAWISRHRQFNYDANGEWAASGQINRQLLEHLLQAEFFRKAPPKSTGRETFHLDWLLSLVTEDFPPADVQATLLELTVSGIAGALESWCHQASEVYVCGGGARNRRLMQRLAEALEPRLLAATDTLGIPAEQVEAAAFAWLACRTLDGRSGNLPGVTGASGPRVLGAIHPA